ncbi:hypothetical protein PRZ48_013198 [Zasmidium cellare]|uniref:Uncharacterized protein n=1 Tax=Zasmidium cellare TaxID=395010 RepID=A0ABR0E3F7_ZASCE|nr:hypothetical protein PRZ48_013198 [Zasmidium cellare]
MSVAAISLLMLAVHSLAGPVAPSPTTYPSAPPAYITPSPDLAERADPLTTITFSTCTQTEDPDQDISGCVCSGFTEVFSWSVCSLGTLVTDVATATNPYIFSTTLPNNAIVAYETTTHYGGVTDGPPDGAGASTTIQAGTQLTVQMDPTSSVNVGWRTAAAEQSALYTAVSSALTVACPSATGDTITQCTDAPAVGGIQYLSHGGLETDGDLDIKVELVSYKDEWVRQALIQSIARGIVGQAAAPNNTWATDYQVPGSDPEYSYNWPTSSWSTVPGVWGSTVSIQSNETDGKVLVQDMVVALHFDPVGEAFECAIYSAVLSGIAALAVIPELGFIGGGGAGSLGRFGVTLGCDAPSW